MPFLAKLQRTADRALDGLAALGRTRPKFDEWQRDRFFAAAPRYVSVVGVDVPSGGRYFVRPDDPAIGASIIRYGAFDGHKIEAVLSLLADRGIVIDHLLDVGANIGTNTVEILTRLPVVTCLAVEPEPTNFELLQLNLVANGLLDRVTAHQIAASDVEGTLAFQLSPTNPGDHRVRALDAPAGNLLGEDAWEVVSVPARTLDSLAAAEGFGASHSTLIYMDVQGHEGQALAGASKLLAAKPPLAIELWPYGLDRARGRDATIAVLQSYPHVFDVSDKVREVDPADLPHIADALGEGYTDLLALPETH